MRKILLLIATVVVMGACSKDEEAPEYNKKLTGNEYLMSVTEIYDKSVDFFKPDSIRVIWKYKKSGDLCEVCEYEYFSYKPEGDIGVNILVHWMGDENFEEKDIKGLITEDILSFSEFPLKGAYKLKE